MNITLPELPCLWASDHAPRFCLWTADDMRAYAIAAIEADRAARGEPVAYRIYIPAQQNQYFVESLEDCQDDLTNCECEVTPLHSICASWTTEGQE